MLLIIQSLWYFLNVSFISHFHMHTHSFNVYGVHYRKIITDLIYYIQNCMLFIHNFLNFYAIVDSFLQIQVWIINKVTNLNKLAILSNDKRTVWTLRFIFWRNNCTRIYNNFSKWRRMINPNLSLINSSISYFLLPKYRIFWLFVELKVFLRHKFL